MRVPSLLPQLINMVVFMIILISKITWTMEKSDSNNLSQTIIKIFTRCLCSWGSHQRISYRKTSFLQQVDHRLWVVLMRNLKWVAFNSTNLWPLSHLYSILRIKNKLMMIYMKGQKTVKMMIVWQVILPVYRLICNIM